MTDREKVRYEAAIAALPALIERLPYSFGRSQSTIEGQAEQVTQAAVRYADALVEELYKEEAEK